MILHKYECEYGVSSACLGLSSLSTATGNANSLLVAPRAWETAALKLYELCTKLETKSGGLGLRSGLQRNLFCFS